MKNYVARAVASANQSRNADRRKHSPSQTISIGSVDGSGVGCGPLTNHQLLHIHLSVTEETKRIEGLCVGGCVRKLNRMVTAIYDGALASTGLKTSQFTVLVAVANREKARPAELTKLLQMDESTLSRNVERMCARGWLRLERDEDHRSHLIEVTDCMSSEPFGQVINRFKRGSGPSELQLWLQVHDAAGVVTR